MSGTISAPQGFFQNDVATPTVISDLQSTVEAAQANVTGAVAAENAASASATAASISATNAANSASAAASSANSAATSLFNIGSSVSQAATSATNAANSATAANTSATNSANSASASAASSTSASSSATGASNSASAAATSATNAANSASAAATSATGASTSATNAANSASAATASAITASAPNIGRNKLHNGTFVIAQRGSGPWTAAGYTLDRWYAFGVHSTGSMAVNQSPLNDTDRAQIGDEEAQKALNYVFTGGAGAGDVDAVFQRIEDVRRLSNKTVTISFWAKAAAGTPKVGVSISQNFGTGGAPSSQVQMVGSSVAISTTWTRYTFTFNVPSTAGKTIGTNGNSNTELDIWLSSGATNNTLSGGVGVQSGAVAFWGVQLEIGSAATPIEKRDYQIETALCQRFYLNDPTPLVFGWNSWAVNGYEALNIRFPVPMGGTPTLNGGGQSGAANFSSLAATNISSFGFTYTAYSSAAGGAAITIGGYTASADL